MAASEKTVGQRTGKFKAMLDTRTRGVGQQEVNGPAVDLPKVDATRMNDRPRTVQVALDAQDRIFIDGAEVNKDSLGTRLQETSIKGASSSEMHLRADRRTHYERVAEIMAIAQNVGIVKIAFVTEAAK